MPLGKDMQYDLSWQEQDKIRRRLDIKNRLKREGVIKRYSPFLQLKGEILTDPALDRYADLRKHGRMPGAPFKPSLFYSLAAMSFGPVILVAIAIYYERKDWLVKVANGDIPYKDREAKTFA